MIVEVRGFGPIKFPDTMTEGEVRDVLRQFEPKKDDTVEKLLSGIHDMLRKQRPTVISEPKVVQVDRQVVVPQERIVEIEKQVNQSPSAWRFDIEREDGEITTIYAEPIDG